MFSHFILRLSFNGFKKMRGGYHHMRWCASWLALTVHIMVGWLQPAHRLPTTDTHSISSLHYNPAHWPGIRSDHGWMKADRVPSSERTVTVCPIICNEPSPKNNYAGFDAFDSDSSLQGKHGKMFQKKHFLILSYGLCLRRWQSLWTAKELADISAQR